MSRSDGSTADYYVLPEGATQLQDLISHRNMNAQIGEITRACYRYGMASHSDMLRDAKKIRFYAQAEVERLEKLAKQEEPSDIISDFPAGYHWADAPDGFEWFATDPEGAFWFKDEPGIRFGGTVWAWPGNSGCEPIDNDRKELFKCKRPTSTAK